MQQRFRGKAAIVTGGAGGIGAAIAARLAAEDAQVLIADLAEPESLGPGIFFHRTDVTRADEVAEMVEQAMRSFGRLDVLINNAGIGHLAETPEMEIYDWERVFALNVGAIFHTCKAAVPAMTTSGGGAIVNVASISGVAGDYGMGAYNASKGAAINYTRSLALDCSRLGIRVNALCPGAIEGTGMRVGEHGGAEYKAAWLKRIPLARFGTAEEMASVAAFLASNDASYVTGAVIVADGGITAHTGQLDFPALRRQRQGD